MTRARALKQVIRARAAKTGERYTTARRHVLAQMRLAAPEPQGAKGAMSANGAKGQSAKGSVSDSSSLKKTGHALDHWFTVLDRFGAVEKGHTAAARHLHDVHKVDGWYSQGITVAYERARGVRSMNQRCDGAFEVSVSKVMAANTARVIKAITDTRQRKKWTASVDAGLTTALTAGLADPKSKGFVVRPDGQARFRYKWDGTIVQFYVLPKPNDKVSLVVQHTKLADGGAVEKYRARWKTAFGSLAKTFGV